MCNFVLQIIISGMISLKCWELLLLFLSLHLYLQIYTHDEEISFGVFSTCNFSHPTTCYSVFCIDHVKHFETLTNIACLRLKRIVFLVLIRGTRFQHPPPSTSSLYTSIYLSIRPKLLKRLKLKG